MASTAALLVSDAEIATLLAFVVSASVSVLDLTVAGWVLVRLDFDDFDDVDEDDEVGVCPEGVGVGTSIIGGQGNVFW